MAEEAKALNSNVSAQCRSALVVSALAAGVAFYAAQDDSLVLWKAAVRVARLAALLSRFGRQH